MDSSFASASRRRTVPAFLLFIVLSVGVYAVAASPAGTGSRSANLRRREQQSSVALPPALLLPGSGANALLEAGKRSLDEVCAP